MYKNYKIAAVIPMYRVADKIKLVLDQLPDLVDFAIVVDDACPEKSGMIVKENYENQTKIHIIYHAKNQGVGGAVISGFKTALDLNADIIVKIDGDNQMDTSILPEMLDELIENKYDYVKGNRFRDLEQLRKMPKLRLFGNSVLSFVVKFVSGNWHIVDPTNGYFAIRAHLLNQLNLEKINKRYFFEIDMLVNLNIVRAYIADFEMPARYFDEKSSLKIHKIIFSFSLLLFKSFAKRIFYRYFLYDFNMASIYSLVGIPMVLWAIIFGGIKWYISIKTNIATPTGTMMLVVLPLMLGIQFLLQAIHIDIYSVPKKSMKRE